MDFEARNTKSSSPEFNYGKSLVKISKIIAAVAVLIASLSWKFPAGARFYCYGAVREIAKAHTVSGTLDMAKITSEHFYVKFKPEERDEAELILETAERFYRPLTQEFGFAGRVKIPVILYSSREELNRSFGWQADESAMGVYWAGAIRVLSPRVWIGDAEPEQFREIFISSGPMAHEITHLMVDYLTGGNYPRWFTEGVAQYEEYKLTGFAFDSPDGALIQPLYSLEELSMKFDDLPNQSLAYSESFAAVRYIVDHYGESALHELIRKMGQGHDLNQALKEVMHIDSARFEAIWQEWAVKNTRK